MLQLKILDKYKNEEWYRAIADYYIRGGAGSMHFSETFEENAALYKFVNNDLSPFLDELNRMCNNLYEFNAAEMNLQHSNYIKGKIERRIGDIVNMANPHRMVLLSSKTIQQKEEQFKEEMQKRVAADMEAVMEKAMKVIKDPQALQQFAITEMDKLSAEKLSYHTFLTELEEIKNKQLEKIYNTEDFLAKKLELARHLIISGELYANVETQGNRIETEIFNPLYCRYDKPDNEESVSKALWFTYYDQMGIAQFLNEYGNELKKEDWEKLSRNSYSFGGANPLKEYQFDNLDYATTIEMVSKPNSYNDYIGKHPMPKKGNLSRFEFIQRVRLWFVAYKEVIFHEFEDEYGVPVKKMLDIKGAIVPNEAKVVDFIDASGNKNKKYVWYEKEKRNELYLMWVPRRYELVLINNDIILRGREVPIQPDFLERPYHDFCLSIKGGSYGSLNSMKVSPVQEALPTNLQIIVIKNLMNRFFAQYEGTVLATDAAQVPDELSSEVPNEDGIIEEADTEANNPLIRAALLRKKTRVAVYDSSSRKGGMPSPTRGIGVSPIPLDSFNEPIAMQNLISMLDMELGVKFGIPPQMEAQVMAGTNVTDNQQAITEANIRSAYQTWWLNRIIAQILEERLVHEDLVLLRQFENNPNMKSINIEYYLPDDTRQVIKIKPEHLNYSDIGLYLSATNNTQVYRQLMLEKLKQNTIDPSTIHIVSEAIGALTSSLSITEVNKKMEKLAKQLQAQQQQNYEQQQALNNQLLEAQRKEMQENQLAALKQKALDQAFLKELELEKAIIQAAKDRNANDVNRNMLDDKLEMEKFVQEQENKRHADKMKIEKEKIDAQKEIAKHKNTKL